jgi:SMC interacting uncharacterized protein involved in chromosome segregation
MDKKRELMMLGMKMDSLEERINHKQEELEELFKEYLSAFNKYKVLIKEQFSIDVEKFFKEA